LGGCGFEFSVGGQTVDAEDLESELRAQLAAQAGSPPQSVSCPTGITAESGKEFDCTGVAPNGSESTIEVTLTNDDGGFDAFVPPGQFDSGGEQGTAQ
jgi:hypothetical protein